MHKLDFKIYPSRHTGLYLRRLQDVPMHFRDTYIPSKSTGPDTQDIGELNMTPPGAGHLLSSILEQGLMSCRWCLLQKLKSSIQKRF